MLDPTKANIFSPDVDIKLGDRERAVLAAYVQQEGFDIIQTLLEDVVRSFNRKLLQVDPAEKERVMSGHLEAHTAGRIYVDFITRLREELNVHTYNAAGMGTKANPENPNAEDFR
jgi:hypothetical protein